MKSQNNLFKTTGIIVLFLVFTTVTSCNQDIAGTADDDIQSAQITNYSVGDDELCPAGTYSSDGTGPDCIAAPEGYYVPTDGATEATACEVGTYQNETGQTECKLAQPGTFVSEKGAAFATPCPVGRYQDETGQSSCKEAEPGSFVDIVGAQAASLCSIGTFSSVSGAAQCIACAEGETTDGPGATFCIAIVNDPVNKDDCKNGGWDEYGFKNQGQCIRFVNTGKDSRI
jgi:hypothetical protein